MPRFKVRWKGPWDSKSRPERILTLTADNKQDAQRLHDRLYPVVSRKITLARRENARHTPSIVRK